MISEAELSHLIHCFPLLRDLETGTRERFLAGANTVALDSDAVVFEAGARCESFLWLVEGTVRVIASDGSGREILLYRVEPGQLCVFTVSCALGHAVYPADGRTECAARAVALPVHHFEGLIARSPVLRRMTFAALSARLHEVMSVVESVTFRRLHLRVVDWILARYASSGSGLIDASHQEIADDLGSAREPVSRTLAVLERDGLVDLGRRRISVLDHSGLVRAASSIQSQIQTETPSRSHRSGVESDRP